MTSAGEKLLVAEWAFGASEEDSMRMMLRAQFDVGAANAAIKNNTLPRLFQSTFEELKPEAAYFLADGGKRTAYFFFDLKDPSQIPVIAEPFFQSLNATVEFVPAMNADDLKAGLERLARRQ